jgi:hypothetical protein
MKAITCLGLVAFPLVAFSQSALTLYNQNFAVVRDSVSLDLKAGVNQVQFSGATAHVEPDSVILRDPKGKVALQILEQNYRNDPVSQELLLSLFEGKTINFEITREKQNTTVRELIPGKIIRSGYVPHYAAMNRYGSEYYQNQMAYAQSSSQPIIEVNGQIRFGLPGQPIFPSLGNDTILKPTLNWQIRSDKDAKLEGEISYVTGGFTWEADYNLVAPEQGDIVDLIGWVTMDNQSGKGFENAKIKLMAGDVKKIQPGAPAFSGMMKAARSLAADESGVSEKTFDEFHLYTLGRQTTLHDRETKQVEFVRAEKVFAPTVYVYDGIEGFGYGFYGGLNNDKNYGTQSNKKVWVMRELVNAETNHLGMPLPKGKLRFYRRNDDGQLEFTGEDMIDHTPRNEMIRVSTGNAFDLVGERKQTDFKTDRADHWLDESFEIKLRNRKKAPVEIRVVEHLYRWNNWEITQKSDDFKKTDAQTIEFRVPVKPDEEKTVTYTVHYSW